MSLESPFEPWEEMQRHTHDLAERLTQGVNELIHSHMNPPQFSWPNPPKPKIFDVEFSSQSFGKKDFGLSIDSSAINGVSAILDIGNRLGQAGAEFGACFSGVVQQFFGSLPLPLPFRQDGIGNEVGSLRVVDSDSQRREAVLAGQKEDLQSFAEQFRDYGFSENVARAVSDEVTEEENFGFSIKSPGQFGKPLGSVNITSTYDSRTDDVESSIVARGDLWRVEASHGGSTPGTENSPMVQVQLGPVLFVRDTKLFLPVHLSKQHLLWYGYDRKNGMHSLCPAVWSKHRRCFFMSIFCLNPFTCSYMDMQFPNGQVTYSAGEGITSSAFLPVFGGLLQAQGHYPGETRLSFSCKNKWGTCVTPTVQWPDKSFSLGVLQTLAWQRSGLMVRPTVQISVCPSFGGSNPGLQAELIHSVKEKLSLICGCALTTHPSAFASVSLGRSKWNGNVGSSGIVVRVETPLCSVGRPAFSVQLNSGLEF